jgi:hypothetical protein
MYSTPMEICSRLGFYSDTFQSDPDTFAECIGQLIITLKRNNVISYASIHPPLEEKLNPAGPSLEENQVKKYYSALLRKYRQQSW